jgi:hypothetical protein
MTMPISILKDDWGQKLSFPEEIKKISDAADWQRLDLRKLKESFYKGYDSACPRMREGGTNVSSAFGLLMLSGINNLANALYTATPAVWPEWVQNVPSTDRQEYYEPLYTVQLPSLKNEGDRYPRTKILGNPQEVVNKVHGSIVGFSRELFDWDRSGQIKSKAGGMGAAMKQYEDIHSQYKVFGIAGSFNGVSVPASTWTGINHLGAALTTPFSASGASGLGNRITTYAALSFSGVNEANVIFTNLIDPMGNKITVSPNRLLHSSNDEVLANTIYNNQYHPTIGGLSGLTLATAASGTSPAMMAENAFKGRFKPVMCRYFAPWAWILMHGPSPAFIKQTYTELEIVQENPNSGSNFEMDEINFKNRSVFTNEWIEPRYAVMGNPGTSITCGGSVGATGAY